MVVTFAGAAMYGLEAGRQGFENYGMALWWTAMRVITAGSDFSPIQRIQKQLNDTAVMSTYLTLHVDPTRAIGDPASWASRGRQFSTNPTYNSDDPLQSAILAQFKQSQN